MAEPQECPICSLTDLLVIGDEIECDTCGHKWLGDVDDVGEVHDLNGALLAPGDDVVVVKDLKLNGKSGGVKRGTKVKSIRLIAGDHPIEGTIEGRTILITADKVKKA